MAPPISTSPRGRRVSASTEGGRPRLASRGTSVGSRRMAAAGRPRSWCRLIRNRPSSPPRKDASAIPCSRKARRACGGSAGSTASAISSPSSGPSSIGTTAPSTRFAGGEPGTNSRSLAPRLTVSASHVRSRRVGSSPPAGREGVAFSSLTSASRSSAGSTRSPDERLVQEPDERRHLTEHANDGGVEPR